MIERKDLIMNNSNDARFLSHLENCIPDYAHNYMLSTYTIILEAWRRGLEIEIKIIKQKSNKIAPYYTISDGKKSHKFSVTRGDLVSPEATKIATNKHLTKEYLINAGVATPKGAHFDAQTNDEDILKYANNFGYPLVLKPTDGTGGKGVIANIKNETEMAHAIKYVRHQLNNKNVIVEQHFEGEDHRLYVVGDEVVGVFKRDPASITGNGKDTIQTLLKKKNEERKKIPSIQGTPIKVDAESKELLRRLDYTLQSVPKKGEVVYLKSKSNVSSGGEAIDVTDDTSDEMKKIAVDAIKSIPTLVQGGVDMMIDRENNKGVVLEINSRAHIRTHLYPSYGKARDIPTAIIDYYFPETKNYNRTHPNKLYINYDYIYSALISRDALSIKIPKISPAPIKLTRFIITGRDYNKSIALRVRRIAFNNKINGYIKPLKNGNISIVIGGHAKNIVNFSNQIKRYFTNNSKRVNIIEKTRTTPIPHGFHIYEGDTEIVYKQDVSEVFFEKYRKLEKDYNDLRKKLAIYENQENLLSITQRQNKELKKRLKHVERSTSWKITQPLRFIAKFKK